MPQVPGEKGVIQMSDLKIALPSEAREHLNQNHTIYVPTKAGFCHCSCGLSFRVGIIVDSENLVTEDPFTVPCPFLLQ